MTTKQQLDRFAGVVDDGTVRRHRASVRSTRPTRGGTIRHPESHLDLVRTGIAIYGIEPAPGVGDELGLRPALTLAVGGRRS